jgi:hypothetical protein
MSTTVLAGQKHLYLVNTDINIDVAYVLRALTICNSAFCPQSAFICLVLVFLNLWWKVNKFLAQQ